MRDRASFAFAARSRSPAASSVDGRRGARRADRARRRRAQAVARRRARRRRCAARPPTRGGVRAGGRRRAGAGASRCATTRSRSPLARNAARPRYRLAELARDDDAVATRRRRRAAHARRGPREGHRRGAATPTSTRVDGRRLRVVVQAADRPRQGPRGRRRRPRSPRPACSPCSAHENAPRARTPRRRRARRPAVTATSPTAGRSSRVVVAETPRGGARGRRRSCASTTTPSRTTSLLRADHPELYRPEKVNPDYPTDTRTATSTAALAAADGRRRRDLHDAGASTTTRWSRTRRWRVWEDGAPDAVRLQPGRVARVRDASRSVFGLDPSSVRVISAHVGGGFGSKGIAARRNVVLAAMAARVSGRPGASSP